MSGKIILTEDGSHSLRNEELDESYHSIHGAIQESQHVFIQAGLLPLLDREKLLILEIGLGTGLNAMLTFQNHGVTIIDYWGIEAYPVDQSTLSQLNYADILDLKEEFEMLHNSPWGQQKNLKPSFQLLKIRQKIETVELPNNSFDLVYYDAFAPSKQPELWSIEILKKVSDSMKAGSVLVTYCAKGQFQRDLKSLDFTIEKLPGPPGKFEMVRATKG